MAGRVITFGCRLNIYESEVIRRNAENAGHGDTIVFNTCAVTSEAVRQARQAIRKARRENPAARIVVTGCAAQVQPELFAGMDEVNQVLGNEEKLKPASYADLPFGLDGEEKVQVNDIMAVRETAAHMVSSFEGKSRAFVQIQNGCDHRCTFCIIPFARGNSRSVPMGAVVEETRALVEAGYGEIVLTGVDITAYGQDLPGQPRLGKLVRTLLRHIPEMQRLRLSSIDSIEADRELMDALASEARLMPHIHLSLQSGDDMILKRMKRRHSRADTIGFCDQVRRLRPDTAFGADIIAGFPTETEAMFANSLAIVDECDLTFLHVFPYSARPGTPAARMPQVNGDIVRERAARLRHKGSEALGRHLQAQQGKRHDVLAETGTRARTEQFAEVELARPATPGSIIAATVTGHRDGRLMAEPLA